MFFGIQVSAPRCVDDSQLGAEAESLKEVIEDLFEHDTEDAYLNWNGSRIALNYKYDISVIIPEILSMVDTLLECRHGTNVVQWPSNTFRATWHLSWSNGQLTILADWIQLTGRVESSLQSVSKLEVQVDDFVAEWSELLRFLASRFDRLVLSPQLEGLSDFRKIVGAVAKKRRGLLYRHETQSLG
jgi:hypothetical protein